MPTPITRRVPAKRLEKTFNFDMTAIAAAAADTSTPDFSRISVLPPVGAIGRDGRGPFTFNINVVTANNALPRASCTSPTRGGHLRRFHLRRSLNGNDQPKQSARQDARTRMKALKATLGKPALKAALAEQQATSTICSQKQT